MCQLAQVALRSPLLPSVVNLADATLAHAALSALAMMYGVSDAAEWVALDEPAMAGAMTAVARVSNLVIDAIATFSDDGRVVEWRKP
jgi:hypothetical protein